MTAFSTRHFSRLTERSPPRGYEKALCFSGKLEFGRKSNKRIP